MRPLFSFVATLLLASVALAGEERTRVGPIVRVSPGTPGIVRAALESEGAAIEPLTWPLPTEGRILVLGLPNEDPAARAFADAFDLLPAGGDLLGGYVVVAWQDGRRTLTAVLADDPAALAAARHALGVEGAWRWVRPRVARRILALASPDDLPEAADTAIAGHATAVLLPAGAAPPTTPARQRLTDHGIALLSEDALARLAPGRLRTEDWNEAWCREGAPTRIPTAPPPYAPAELEGVEGVIVRHGCGALEILTALSGALHEGTHDPRPAWKRQLLPLLPRTWTSPLDLLRRAARRLAQEAAATPGAAWWMAPLAQDLAALDIDGRTLAVPYVPSRVVVDGRLDERAWAHAARWAWTTTTAAGKGRAPIEVLALSDGRRLYLAFRTSAPHVVADVRVRDALGGESQVVFASDPNGRGKGPAGSHGTYPPAFAEAWTEEAYVGEVSFPARALAGDAYPTRVFELEVRPTVDGRVTRPNRITLVVIP